jgi:SpoVK/Ycf46/Vps4 family AAA+-type ATPase
MNSNLQEIISTAVAQAITAVLPTIQQNAQMPPPKLPIPSNSEAAPGTSKRKKNQQLRRDLHISDEDSSLSDESESDSESKISHVGRKSGQPIQPRIAPCKDLESMEECPQCAKQMLKKSIKRHLRLHCPNGPYAPPEAKRSSSRISLLSNSTAASRRTDRDSEGERERELQQWADYFELNAHVPDQDFDSVTGNEKLKRDLMNYIVKPRLEPERYSKLQRRPAHILFSGPPGTGKTLITRALAGSLGWRLIEVTAHVLNSKWHGEPAIATAALFRAAKDIQPALILLDEADSMVSHRKSETHESARVNQILVEMADLSDSLHSVIVVATTNHLDRIDPAALDRFTMKFVLPAPTVEDRVAFIKRYYSSQEHQAELYDEELNEIARITKDSSYRQIKEILWVASFRANQRKGSSGPAVTTSTDILTTLKKRQFT